MLVIYHSRGALPARQAAALHLGWVTPADSQQEVFERLGGRGAFATLGLWALGCDQAGRTVYAFGRASRPDVVHRAFHGMAHLFGLERDTFLLANVGAPVAWTDIGVRSPDRMGLHRLADWLALVGLQRGWQDAAAATRTMEERLKARGEA